MVADGMTPVQALHAATDVAARVLREQDHFGRIAPGLRADFVVLDDALGVREVFIGGTPVFDR